MIKYSIVDECGEVIKGGGIHTSPEDISDIIKNKKSVVLKHEDSYEIITPVGHKTAIVHNVPAHQHSSILLRVLSFYCVGWAVWMWIFGGINTFKFYEGINTVLGKPHNETIFYIEIITIGIISFLSSLRRGYGLIGYTLQAAWWLFLTMFFTQRTSSTAILIYGSFFLFSMYGIYLVRKK